AHQESTNHNDLRLAALQAQPAAPASPPGASGNIQGPRSSVTAEALPELGVIVIRGNNPQDVAAVMQIIDFIQKLGQGAEVQIRLVPLAQADATSVANTLNQLYSRVQVAPSGNVAL